MSPVVVFQESLSGPTAPRRRSGHPRTRARRLAGLDLAGRWLGVTALLILVDVAVAHAELVFFTPSRSDAAVSVYVTDNRSDADCWIFVTGSRTEARTHRAFWFVTPNRTEATLRVYKSPTRADAGQVIFFTPNRTDAKCPSRSRHP